jgi:hypothetical protein
VAGPSCAVENGPVCPEALPTPPERSIRSGRKATYAHSAIAARLFSCQNVRKAMDDADPNDIFVSHAEKLELVSSLRLSRGMPRSLLSSGLTQHSK